MQVTKTVKETRDLIMTCTFFGHRSYCGECNEKLKEEIEKVINEGVKDFLVGHNGGFDSNVKQVLEELKKIH